MLKTPYKTRGKKERHEALFPDLVKEIDEDRAKRSGEVSWPDQGSDAYKAECERVAAPLLGPQLTDRQRKRFLSKVVRAFSLCLWLPGCNPPRVKDFVADIRLQPGAVPKVTQQFPLSRYDQLRLEYHEDCEVSEGKARWLLPGERSEWGSPSFVVDQDGKGLMGRPVRDYR